MGQFRILLSIVNSDSDRIYSFKRWLSMSRFLKVPQPNWQSAYGISGPGSTYTRKQRVRDIFQNQIPIPKSTSDRIAQLWAEEIKVIVQNAVESVEAEQNSNR